MYIYIYIYIYICVCVCVCVCVFVRVCFIIKIFNVEQCNQNVNRRFIPKRGY